MNPILTKNLTAGGAISPYRIVKFGSDDDTVLQAAAETDLLLGVADLPEGGDAASGDSVDLILSGLADVEYGGTVARGNLLTSDSDGKAIAVTTAMLLAGPVKTIGRAYVSAVSGDIGPMMVLQSEVSSFAGSPAGATIVVGAEDTNVINAAIQLTDDNGDDLAVRGTILAYLSDDANGDSIMTTGHSTAPAIGTDGLIVPLVAKKVFLLTSESDGDIDIDFTETGALTTYLVLVMPNGKRVVSGAITHAA